jgi:hypothetical protein
LLPINLSGPAERSIFRFGFVDFEDGFAAFAEARMTFFEAGLLAETFRVSLETLRADRVLCATDFFAELFFFFSLAIA